ncbi:MAG: hypothetical protein KME25_33460 [Symplocastrum torsivum CPER-KK1]|uniref:Uncharacterized protein n=1 Tax=Symplocastrum torsivum CPER-KK1 TaxID=450513 RepID=A0A951PUR9_9CYAN|nr:hypothetical protein [Symplocastrum torsivum CPER-KK1]
MGIFTHRIGDRIRASSRCLSPTWTTSPYLSERCLQDCPVCSGQLARERRSHPQSSKRLSPTWTT